MDTEAASWVALRQAQALRDSVIWSLAGLAIAPQKGSVGKWLVRQGLEGIKASKEKPSIRIHIAVTDAFKAANDGIDLEKLAPAHQCPDARLGDIGESRSGTGWQNVANFIITSAFVRLLGAEEQFEMDVLKALFHYRPQGTMGRRKNVVPKPIAAAVILEKPVKDAKGRLTYSKPHLWTWLRRQADNRGKRADIFKDVFGIKLIPDGYTPLQKDEWYKKRNKIAHGFEGVTMTLGEYVSVEVFVAKAVMFIGQQCQDKLKVSV